MQNIYERLLLKKDKKVEWIKMKEVEFLTLENFEKNEIADKLCAKVNRVNWKFMKGSIIKNDEIYDI